MLAEPPVEAMTIDHFLAVAVSQQLQKTMYFS
jgi:hypothetical protein